MHTHPCPRGTSSHACTVHGGKLGQVTAGAEMSAPQPARPRQCGWERAWQAQCSPELLLGVRSRSVAAVRWHLARHAGSRPCWELAAKHGSWEHSADWPSQQRGHGAGEGWSTLQPRPLRLSDRPHVCLSLLVRLPTALPLFLCYPGRWLCWPVIAALASAPLLPAPG